MRYIPKDDTPKIIEDFKSIQHAAGLTANYKNFRDKSLLNDILRREQHNLCCYCQRRIDHYQGNKVSGAHNEHLYPQSKDPGDGSVDLEYANIFACCIASKGQKENSQHCGEAKGEKVIVGSIRNPQCQDLFKYNLIGEILPKGRFNDWKDYISNYNDLSFDQKELVDEIKVLNLNCNSLVEERKKLIETIAIWVINTPGEDVVSQLKSWESSREFPIFYNTIQYILKGYNL